MTAFSIKAENRSDRPFQEGDTVGMGSVAMIGTVRFKGGEFIFELDVAEYTVVREQRGERYCTLMVNRRLPYYELLANGTRKELDGL